MRADAIVLGGGAVGCLSALRLAQRGLAVVVVERGEPGGEASGAAAGILGAQAETSKPGPLVDLALFSRMLYPKLVEELGGDIGYRACGALVVAHDEAEAAQLEARFAWQRAAGLTVEKLDARALAEREPALSPAVGALAFPDDHQIDPPRLVRALRSACANAGVEFLRAEARRVRHDHRRVLGADVGSGTLDAGVVVVAGGAWSALLDGAGLPERAVFPVRGQLIEFACARPPLAHVVYGDGGYLVPRSDGRVVCGSTEEQAGFQKSVTDAARATLHARARRLCPSLDGADQPIARAWCGLRPGTADGLPLLGKTSVEGLIVATGHFRNGILLAPATAELVAALVTGAPPAVDLAPFSPSRL